MWIRAYNINKSLERASSHLREICSGSRVEVEDIEVKDIKLVRCTPRENVKLLGWIYLVRRALRLLVSRNYPLPRGLRDILNFAV